MSAASAVTRVTLAAFLLWTMCTQGLPEAQAQPKIGKKEYPLSSGTTVPAGRMEAIGSIVGGGTCTASLIDQKTVLTAAHCMCACDCEPVCKPTKCVSRATFTLLDVYPVDDPKTPTDESKTRQHVEIGGTVILHPDFCTKSWLYYDYAVVKLDRPVYEVAKVWHACLSPPTVEPRKGDRLTLVGAGSTGEGCTDKPKGKRMAVLQAESAGPLGIKFADPVIYACPGDSGGPVLDPYGCVAGVASHNDVKAGESTYRPTYPVYAWISAHMEPLGDDVRAANCRLYAQTAVSQNEQRRTRSCRAVSPNDPKWVSNLEHHFKWCMQQGGQQILEAGTNEREAFLAASCKPAYESGMTKRCVAYASTAVAQQRNNVNRRCNLTGPEWSLDFDYHYTWCAGGVPKAAADAGTARRSNALQNCR